MWSGLCAALCGLDCVIVCGLGCGKHCVWVACGTVNVYIVEREVHGGFSVRLVLSFTVREVHIITEAICNISGKSSQVAVGMYVQSLSAVSELNMVSGTSYMVSINATFSVLLFHSNPFDVFSQNMSTQINIFKFPEFVLYIRFILKFTMCIH